MTQDYQRAHAINENDVSEKFEIYLSQCRPHGERFQNFLTFFSGKDLLWSMESSLKSLGFASPNEFRERILKGLENSLDSVWTWLPGSGKIYEPS